MLSRAASRDLSPARGSSPTAAGSAFRDASRPNSRLGKRRVTLAAEAPAAQMAADGAQPGDLSSDSDDDSFRPSDSDAEAMSSGSSDADRSSSGGGSSDADGSPDADGQMSVDGTDSSSGDDDNGGSLPVLSESPPVEAPPWPPYRDAAASAPTAARVSGQTPAAPAAVAGTQAAELLSGSGALRWQDAGDAATADELLRCEYHANWLSVHRACWSCCVCGLNANRLHWTARFQHELQANAGGMLPATMCAKKTHAIPKRFGAALACRTSQPQQQEVDDYDAEYDRGRMKKVVVCSGDHGDHQCDSSQILENSRQRDVCSVGALLERGAVLAAGEAKAARR
jgi:hypothetical protein